MRKVATVQSPRPVTTGRELLCRGPVVHIKVPPNATPATFSGGKIELAYLYFPQGVNDGKVQSHVHHRGANVCGKTISAHVSIYKRLLDDGRAFLYLDYVPTEEPVTHKCVVFQYAARLARTEAMVVFETLPPLRGAIVIAPLDTEIRELQGAVGIFAEGAKSK